MNTQLGFGGKPRPKDERDFQVSLGSGTSTPTTFFSPVPTIYMQDKYPTCGAHAGASTVDILTKSTVSPKFLWKVIKTLDGYGLEDGTDLRSICKALQQSGDCDLSLLDDSLESSLQAYSDISEITQQMKDNASTRKALSYSFLDNPTFQQIKDAIYQHGAVILLVDIGDGWWINGWSEQATCPVKVGNFVGHHFICAYGFDENYIYFVNSWSTQWGRNGIGYFDASYVPHVLELGTVTVNVVPPVVKFQFTRDLSVGSWGSDVLKLQQLLVSKRFGNFTPTGFFGAKTRAAVMAYQEKNGIEPISGYVGPKTRAKLNT